MFVFGYEGCSILLPYKVYNDILDDTASDKILFKCNSCRCFVINVSIDWFAKQIIYCLYLLLLDIKDK